MSFVTWYEMDSNQKWKAKKDSIELLELLTLTLEYELYCSKENVFPEWDG